MARETLDPLVRRAGSRRDARLLGARARGASLWGTRVGVPATEIREVVDVVLIRPDPVRPAA
ncbi:MAG: hypothetical protein H0X39_11475 [Actinobacteria bacterium]|nr:hypothetical protein [Actinomycetota bacterium]